MAWRILVPQPDGGIWGISRMAGARAEAGRALRRTVPRSSHAVWDPGGRPSPLLLLEVSNRRRLPDLVPIRDARMRASPFAFLRGAPG
jgi:hypothetical protein